VLSELLADIRDQIGCLYKLTECVAVMDMLHAFAHACTLSDYGRHLAPHVAFTARVVCYTLTCLTWSSRSSSLFC